MSEGSFYRFLSNIEIWSKKDKKSPLARSTRCSKFSCNTPSQSIKKAYSCIKKNLLSQTNQEFQGRIVLHPLEEQLLQSLRKRNTLKGIFNAQLRGEIKELRKRLIEEDVYHSLQTYGTCTESNRTAPEINMCNKDTRQQLKLFTIQKMLSELQKEDFESMKQKSDLLALGEQKVKKMSEKINKRKL